MRGSNCQFLIIVGFLALSIPGLSRADPWVVTPGFSPAGQAGEYVTGVDAGAGPGSPNPNSAGASSLFKNTLSGQFTTSTVDFGSSFSSWSLTSNGSWTSGVNTPQFSGLKSMTTGIDYGSAPAPYHYGITDVTNQVAANSDIGYGVDGPSHFEFVPSLTATTSSLVIHSDTAFQAFGFYLTGLGNSKGVVEVEVDGTPVPALTLTGSSRGGILYLGYIGNTSIHDLSLVMGDKPGGSRDVFGISNILLGASVPEPSVLVLSALGLAGFLGVNLLRKGRGGARC